MLCTFQKERVKKPRQRVRQERVVPNDVKYFWRFENNFSVELSQIKQSLFQQQQDNVTPNCSSTSFTTSIYNSFNLNLHSVLETLP